MKKVSIAIDGPSGAGKSTLARALAKEKEYLYVDTGAIYRTLGCYVWRRGADPKDEAAVMKLLRSAKVELRYGGDGSQRMSYQEIYKQKLTTADEAVKVVKSGDWVDYGWCVGTPDALDKALAKRADELTDVNIRGGILTRRPAIADVPDAPKHFT